MMLTGSLSPRITFGVQGDNSFTLSKTLESDTARAASNIN